MNNSNRFRLAVAITANAGTLALLAAGALTMVGCAEQATAKPPVPCTATIPGVDSYPADAGDGFIDAPFVAWLDTQATPVDYREDGYWYDATGAVIGWSVQEDSEICVIG